MEFITRFNVGDKVYFYIETENIYGIGKVMEIRTSSKWESPRYTIENKYLKQRPESWYRTGNENFRYDAYLERWEDFGVFENLEELKDYISSRQRKELEQLKEAKK